MWYTLELPLRGVRKACGQTNLDVGTRGALPHKSQVSLLVHLQEPRQPLFNRLHKSHMLSPRVNLRLK